MDVTSDLETQQYWVVFSGQTDKFWLRLLKPGFRHCYVLINDGLRWISVDPMLHRMEVLMHHVPPDFDLPGWLESRGLKSLAVRQTGFQDKPMVPMPFSCVETVKRIIGLRKLSLFTPWQLYRHLSKLTSKEIKSWEA